MSDEVADAYAQYRALMFTIAYQMTASVEDSEDIVSEVFLRYRRTLVEGGAVHAPRAFLTAATTRLSIDLLRSARHRRETYIGPWLPEPLITDNESDLAARAEVADTLSMAFLVLLESLTPVERAAFLLRDVFDFDYGEIADIIGKSESNCRQLVKRAKDHIADRKPRFEASEAERNRIARTFFTALETGELQLLVDLLAGDVVAYGDGGGRGPSLPRPVHGRDKVARLLEALSDFVKRHDLSVTQATINRQPGAVVLDAKRRLLNVLTIDILDGQVQAVRSVINPDKLRHLGPLLDTRTLTTISSHGDDSTGRDGR